MRDDTDTTRPEPTPPTSTTRPASGEADRSTTATAERTDGLPMIPDDERDDARRRWDDIEARFVDDPAGATKEADALLGDTIDGITSRWHDRRSELRDGWDREDASTEELRTTLKRYRASLESLLSR